MAKKVKGGESIEELEFKHDEARRAKIGGVEAYFLIVFSVIADILDIIAFVLALTVAGALIAVILKFFSLMISGFIVMWSFLRGLLGRFVIKAVIILILGFILDELSMGLLPIKTISIVIVIWLNNHFTKKQLKEILSVLERVV